MIPDIRPLVLAIKRRQIDVVLGIGIATFSAIAAEVHPEWKGFPWRFSDAWIIYVSSSITVVLALWVGIRAWRFAEPSLEPLPPALPSAIKGLQPWTLSDGAFYPKLGRGPELASLLTYARDDQLPLSIIAGPSGTGKTSLLQAGLRYALGAENCIYWEAVPVQPAERLLYAVKQQLPDIAKPLPEVEDLALLAGALKTRTILIIDQFEQLNESQEAHRPVFKFLETIAKCAPPHRLSVLISFRMEYLANWAYFEDRIRYRSEQILLRPLSPRVAAEVTASICSAAHFSVEQSLIKSLLSELYDSGGISPLDLSISLESLFDLVKASESDELTERQFVLLRIP